MFEGVERGGGGGEGRRRKQLQSDNTNKRIRNDYCFVNDRQYLGLASFLSFSPFSLFTKKPKSKRGERRGGGGIACNLEPEGLW